MSLAHSPSSPPDTHVHLPHPRNPNFTGRDAALRDIRRTLVDAPAHSRSLALHGLGGVGKTQLAGEYAHRFREHYRLIWWLRAEESTTLLFDFLQLAARLTGRSAQTTAPEDLVAAGRAALDRRDDWLLVFDNAQGPAALAPFLPPAGRGHVLVTSRNPNWRGVARSVQVHPLNRDES